MRNRRIRQGNTILFDAKDVLVDRSKEGLVLLEMRRGPLSYTTEEGVRFWQHHPYQWVSGDEAKILKQHLSPEFREVDLSDVEDYYSYY